MACDRRQARAAWVERGSQAASLAQDEGRAVEEGEEPTTDSLTEGGYGDEGLTLEERAEAWREGWDSYARAIVEVR